ncbi:hypothetical protein ACVWXL_005800 [Bradyrhizobium sp. GM22.5]
MANKTNVATSAAPFRYDLDLRYHADGFRLLRGLQ